MEKRFFLFGNVTASLCSVKKKNRNAQSSLIQWLDAPHCIFHSQPEIVPGIYIILSSRSS